MECKHILNVFQFFQLSYQFCSYNIAVKDFDCMALKSCKSQFSSHFSREEEEFHVHEHDCATGPDGKQRAGEQHTRVMSLSARGVMMLRILHIVKCLFPEV